VRLTVLGSGASFPGAGHACSGYLLEAGGTRVMLECGAGSVANAASVTDVTTLDGVVVSHTHADHFADLYTLQAALRFAPQGAVGCVPLHLPAGLFEMMGCLLSEHGRAELVEAYRPHVLRDGESVTIGEITLVPRAVEHAGPTFAFMVEAGGARLGYTADARYDVALRDAVAGCDVLLCECTLPTAYAGAAPHLAPAEAGRLATEAGARLLVLTHLWPAADHGRLLADAGAAYPGEVALARELMTIEVGEPAQRAGGGVSR
jgi:ribonuclease BN (tRNA processing enzyme)